ncbi:ATP binding protein [Aureococcus anophagefferens]|nr:ATP binding protein [Aureococcus anophagefferens]
MLGRMLGRILLLCGVARALVAPGPARGRRALRHAFDGDGDGFATSSDSFDVMDDEGWVHEGEERDAGVTIHASMDCAEEPVDASTYFFGNEDDDAELRRLLGELEAEFAGEAAPRARRSSTACGPATRCSTGPPSTSRSTRARPSPSRRRRRAGARSPGAPWRPATPALEAYAANGAASAQDDDEYSWLLGNATAAARGGGAAASGFGSMGSSVGLDLARRTRGGAVDASGAPRLLTPSCPPCPLPARVAAAEVSAEVVRKLRDDAIACLAEAGAAPRRASGASSACRSAGDATREATITAARLGGFDAVHLITEPEAAALAYGSRVRGGGATQRVLVFDLGGGTFDASVVLLADANATLASLGGDAKLGGDDFDAALAEHLSDRFYDAHGLPVKHALSSEADVVAGARGLARVGEDGKRARGGRPLDLEATVSRRLFEALCAPLLARLEATTRDVCEAAGVALPGDGAGPPLDSVLLVGGARACPPSAGSSGA